MDYQFIRNDHNEALAIFSGDHLVLGHFLSTELVDKPDMISKIQKAIDAIEKRHIESFEWIGKEFKLRIEPGEACITALVLAHDVYDELPESTQLYDTEQKIECGLLDFSAALSEWSLFLNE